VSLATLAVGASTVASMAALVVSKGGGHAKDLVVQSASHSNTR